MKTKVLVVVAAFVASALVVIGVVSCKKETGCATVNSQSDCEKRCTKGQLGRVRYTYNPGTKECCCE